MYSGRKQGNSNIAIGCIITLVAAVCILVDSFVIGKERFFLLLNGNLGKPADIFFSIWTWLGDGLLWIPIGLLVIFYRKKRIPLLIGAILFSTAFTQLPKNTLFAETLRPTAAISNGSIHTVPGVQVHTTHSFPSGHTMTAFTVFLLACLLINGRWIIPAGFLYALMVGYSRIYLAQHFPLDVGGGMIGAVFSIWLAIFFQQQWDKKNEPASK